ncbi:MAG: FHA domain-containing protein [Acidobacteriota bacterium]
MPDSKPASTPGNTSVHLLDPARGESIQVWRFQGRSLIRIGRSEDNHIVIADPSVSRLHAELRYQEGCWRIVNLGKNGILVGGRSVSEADLEDHTTFRLGSAGPLLRFDRCEVKFDGLNTITLDSLAPGPSIQIDQVQKDVQVREIAESEYFQQLQRISRKLRSQDGTAQGS